MAPVAWRLARVEPAFRFGYNSRGTRLQRFILALALAEETRPGRYKLSRSSLNSFRAVLALKFPNFAMAFMMPVVKNDYNIYPSCPSSRNGMGTPSSRGSSLSGSPTAASFMSSHRNSQTPAFLSSTPKSGSQTSLHNFHSKLLDKLRKTFRGKDVSEEGQSSSSIPAIR